MLDTFYLPYPLTRWLPLPDAWWWDRIEEATLVLAIFMTVGLFTRVVTPLLALLFTYSFLLSQWNSYHHMLVFVWVLWILALSDCGRHFSLDALLFHRGRPARAHRPRPTAARR